MARSLGLLFLLILTGMSILIWHNLQYNKTAPQNKEYDDLILEASMRYSIDPDLIRAVIWKESRFDSQAFGRAKERGLMQVTPVAGQEWAKASKIEIFQPEDLFNPRTGIHAGTWYLARARTRWKIADMPEVFALAEYNAGRTHALRWAKDLEPLRAKDFLERIDFPSTKTYITDILQQYQRYKNPSNPLSLQEMWKNLKEDISTTAQSQLPAANSSPSTESTVSPAPTPQIEEIKQTETLPPSSSNQ